MVWSNLFGQKNSLTVPCGCSSCCGYDLEDTSSNAFPDTIWASFGHYQGSWHSIPMYKRVNQPDCPCHSSKQINYTSTEINVYDTGIPGNNNYTCCLTLSLTIACSDGDRQSYDDIIPKGECQFILGLYWTGGEPMSYTVDVSDVPSNPSALRASCPLSVDFQGGGSISQPACGYNGIIYEDWLVTIRRDPFTPSGYIPYEPCPWTCCPDNATTKYATVTSSCDYIDGLVIELEYIGEKYWEGQLRCGLLTFSYFEGRIWLDEDECDPSLLIEGSSSTACFQVLNAHDSVGCSSRTFTGTWAGGSALGCRCCESGDTITVVVSD